MTELSLLDCFWWLAGKPEQRWRAAVSLAEHLKEDGSRAPYCVERLCRGLESTRDGAREGFAAAIGVAVEAGVLGAREVGEELKKRWERKKADKNEARAADLALVLGALVLTRARRPDPELVDPLWHVVEKRKWLAALAARVVVEMCQGEAKSRIEAKVTIEKREDLEPERAAVLLARGLLEVSDRLDRPLARAARAFPAVHVLWELALRAGAWSLLDKHVSSGSLEVRAEALLAAVEHALSSDDPVALSPAVCACLWRAQGSASHLAPLATRLLRRIAAEKKPLEWRAKAASALVCRGPADHATLRALMEGLDADTLVDLVFSRPQCLQVLRARAKSEDDPKYRAGALVAAARIGFFESPIRGEVAKKPVAAKPLAAALGIDPDFARGLLARAAAFDDDDDGATRAGAVAALWALVADVFRDDLGTLLVAWRALRRLCVPRGVTDDVDDDDDDPACLWARCALLYSSGGGENDAELGEIAKTRATTILDAAKTCCALLGLAHGTPSSRAARIVVTRAWAKACARFDLDDETLDYLIYAACGLEEPGDDDDDDDNDDDDENQEEEEEDDDDDNDDDDENQEEEEEAADLREEADDDIVLDAEGAAAYFGSSNDAEETLLAARQSHRKAGRVENRKTELQVQLRVLDLLERALRTKPSLRAAVALAELSIRLEKEDFPEARDLLKRVAGLAEALRGAKILDTHHETAATSLQALLARRPGPAASRVVSNACALAVKGFKDPAVPSFDVAKAAYEAATREALGKRRSTLRPQVLRDAVHRAPELARRAILPGLPVLVVGAPSPFLRLEALAIAIELLAVAPDDPIFDQVATSLADLLRDASMRKSDRAKKLLDAAALLLKKKNNKRSSQDINDALRDAVSQAANHFPHNGAIKTRADRILQPTGPGGGGGGGDPPAKRKANELAAPAFSSKKKNKRQKPSSSSCKATTTTTTDTRHHHRRRRARVTE